MLMLQSVLTSFMFWSYVPLVTLVANVAVLVVKIPFEVIPLLSNLAKRPCTQVLAL
jgi:hypothetical protein